MEDQQVQAVFTQRLTEYADQRCGFYDGLSLPDLMRKDLVMISFHGMGSITEVVEHAFSAFESSSEEGVWGTTFQRIITEISTAVDAGDLYVQRGSVLWIVEVKSSTNTFTSASEAQTLREIKQRVNEHSRMRTPTVTSVRGLIGIMRGPASDEDKVYAGTKTGTEDIKGFGYKKLVGSAFLAWLTGYGDITQFMNGLEGQIIKVGQARNMALARIKEETEKLLGLRGLDNDTANLLEFLS